MTYRQAILPILITSLITKIKIPYSYQKSFRLERVEGLLRLLDNPQDSFAKCLHMPAPKAKGSVCAFAANILRAAGYRRFIHLPALVGCEGGYGFYLTNHESRVTNHDFEGMISRRELGRSGGEIETGN